MAPVSAIKLIRTDTTLDLSQKAEKGMHVACDPSQLYGLSPIPRTLNRGFLQHNHTSLLFNMADALDGTLGM
jgi:hypothetical protein